MRIVCVFGIATPSVLAIDDDSVQFAGDGDLVYGGDNDDNDNDDGGECYRKIGNGCA